MKFDYNTYRDLIKKEKKRLTLGLKDYNCGSFFADLIYILKIIVKRHLMEPYYLRLLDWKAVYDRYSTATSYYLMIDRLEKAGVITPIREGSYEEHRAGTYKLNLATFIALLVIVSEKVNDIEPIVTLLNTYLSPIPIHSNPLFPISITQNEKIVPSDLEENIMEKLVTDLHSQLINKTDYWELYKERSESNRIKPFIDQIDKSKETKLKLFFSGKMPLTDEEQAIILSHFDQVKFRSPLIKGLDDNICWLRDQNYDYSCNYRSEFRKTRTGYMAYIRGRQVDYSYALIEKTDRQNMLARSGMYGEFDLHSAIFSVTRLLNKGIFDVDWDIKTELMKNNYMYENGTALNRSDFKGYHILFSLYFAKNKKAYGDYKRGAKEKNYPYLSESEYTRLYSDIVDLVGPFEDYFAGIFLYESLLELKVIRKMIERGYKVGNAYDCFFFDLNEVSEEEVKQIITESAYEMYKEVK